jgi:glycosyltransferase involved in cell wall biosynthesis
VPMTFLVALLGRRDTPVDGVEDYCTFLGEALGRRGVQLTKVRVNWIDEGWFGALRQLRRDSLEWRDRWVLLQYTALGWSRRGFPVWALIMQRTLRRRGVRTAAVFHEIYRQSERSPRLIDKIRGGFQDWVIRKLYEGCHTAIFVDPIATIRWLPKSDTKSIFVPIGANIPEPAERSEPAREERSATKTVAIFCLTEPPKQQTEIADIAYAVRCAASQISRMRVIFLGRGTAEAKEEIERAFSGTEAEVRNLGLVSAAEISEILTRADAMLCVRGRITPRRGSVMAGVACGVPIAGYGGVAEGTPLAEAGIEFVPYRDREALGGALTRILEDSHLHASLRERSLRAQRKYFSWDAIAGSLATSLGLATNTTDNVPGRK